MVFNTFDLLELPLHSLRSTLNQIISIHRLKLFNKLVNALTQKLETMHLQMISRYFQEKQDL